MGEKKEANNEGIGRTGVSSEKRRNEIGGNATEHMRARQQCEKECHNDDK